MFFLILSVHLHFDPNGSSNSLLCSYKMCLKSFRTRTVKNQNMQVLKKILLFFNHSPSRFIYLLACSYNFFLSLLGRLLFGMLFSSFVTVSEMHYGLEMPTFQSNCEFGEEKIVCRCEVRWVGWVMRHRNFPLSQKLLHNWSVIWYCTVVQQEPVFHLVQGGPHLTHSF
jgi:hypothetical protein